jgi:uncharacterized protein (DUF697 family)
VSGAEVRATAAEMRSAATTTEVGSATAASVAAAAAEAVLRIAQRWRASHHDAQQHRTQGSQNAHFVHSCHLSSIAAASRQSEVVSLSN